MYKILDALQAGSYTLLVLDRPLEKHTGNSAFIEGTKYEMVPVYGIPINAAHVAIKATGDFAGKELSTN